MFTVYGVTVGVNAVEEELGLTLLQRNLLSLPPCIFAK